MHSKSRMAYPQRRGAQVVGAKEGGAAAGGGGGPSPKLVLGPPGVQCLLHGLEPAISPLSDPPEQVSRKFQTNTFIPVAPFTSGRVLHAAITFPKIHSASGTLNLMLGNSLIAVACWRLCGALPFPLYWLPKSTLPRPPVRCPPATPLGSCHTFTQPEAYNSLLRHYAAAPALRWVRMVTAALQAPNGPVARCTAAYTCAGT